MRIVVKVIDWLGMMCMLFGMINLLSGYVVNAVVLLGNSLACLIYVWAMHRYKLNKPLDK